MSAEDKIDFGRLESDLRSLVASDDLYWTRNDAKFRAAEQTKTYREFKKFVDVSRKYLDSVGSQTFTV